MKKSKPATVEAAPKIKTGKGGQAKQDSAGKPAKDKSAKGRTAKDKPAKTPAFDFVGKVESIGVKAEAGKLLFTWGLKGRNGLRRTFQIVAAESVVLDAMVSVITAAHATGTKIGIGLGAGDEVVEVQIRPGLGKNG